jgi:hypothetical protein
MMHEVGLASRLSLILRGALNVTLQLNPIYQQTKPEIADA